MIATGCREICKVQTFMESLFSLFRRGNRYRSLVLITIGLAMLAGSNLAVQGITDRVTNELVQVALILAGLTVGSLLFRRTRAGASTPKQRSESDVE